MDRASQHCTGGSDQNHSQGRGVGGREGCNKAKWLPEEPLPISEKRREVKGKGERKDITV